VIGYNNVKAPVSQKCLDRSKLLEVDVRKVDLVALILEGQIVSICNDIGVPRLISLRRTKGRAETSNVPYSSCAR
jgi:hypothetical protein